MDKLKKQIQRQLVASILKEKCKEADNIIFRESWCTQERVIRFTTPLFRDLFGEIPYDGGRWRTGYSTIYEINIDFDSFVVNCVVDISSIPAEKKNDYKKLLEACGKVFNETDVNVILKSWNLTDNMADTNKLIQLFDNLLTKDIPYFEQEIKDKISDSNSDSLTEGERIESISEKYERNKKARAACLAFYGYSCVVCGMDFGKTYGPEFANIIEVHHVVPISKIGKEYVVDPINDLVPVCPNCHTALHSKPGGVYTVEELKRIRNKN